MVPFAGFTILIFHLPDRYVHPCSEGSGLVKGSGGHDFLDGGFPVRHEATRCDAAATVGQNIRIGLCTMRYDHITATTEQANVGRSRVDDYRVIFPYVGCQLSSLHKGRTGEDCQQSA